MLPLVLLPGIDELSPRLSSTAAVPQSLELVTARCWLELKQYSELPITERFAKSNSAVEFANACFAKKVVGLVLKI